MKSCPTCLRSFPNDAGFCPEDGTELASMSQVPLDPSEDKRIGMVLANRYQIRRVVADGGMGRVYEGVDRRDEQRVAIKVLHDEVSEDEVALERFRREYETSANLSHDHIVKVLDFRRDRDHHIWFLVMEFLDGEELRHILKRDKILAPERLIRMMSQVALGLDEAHTRELVHRDLKPDNLFLCGTREGDVCKILDFGSVKDKGAQRKLTVLGTTIGSPYYMSPEQAQALETIDCRADVFSLAAVAYECVTGHVPFEGNNGPAILLAIMTHEPIPATARAHGQLIVPPPAIDDVFDLSLAKDPEFRTKTVGALADALGHAYGLTGNHLDWATMPQATLRAQIREALAHLPKPAVLPSAHPDSMARPATPQGSYPTDSILPPVAAPRRWVAPLVIGGLAVLIGVTVTLALALVR